MAKSTAKSKAKTQEDVSEDLGSIILSAINSSFSDEQGDMACMLSRLEKVDNWVSTSNDMLDILMSNRINGGFPCGKITEISGLESSGKSLLAATALASNQKNGGISVLIDTEEAIEPTFMKAIGIDPEKLIYVRCDTVEKVFVTLERVIHEARNSSRSVPVTIVVDSIAGVSTAGELEDNYEMTGYNMDKAKFLSKAMRKITGLIGRERISVIFTNQVRTKIGMSFGDPYTTTGGKALAFHASLRLRIKAIGQLKKKIHGIEVTIGSKTRITVIKSRLGPAHRSIDYDIYYDSGIDNYGSYIEVAKLYKIIALRGNMYEYVDKETGEVTKFLARDFATIMETNPELKAKLYQDISDKMILVYKGEKHSVLDGDVLEDTTHVGEEDE